MALGLRWVSAAAKEEEPQGAQTAANAAGQNLYLDELEHLADLHERGAHY